MRIKLVFNFLSSVNFERTIYRANSSILFELFLIMIVVSKFFYQDPAKARQTKKLMRAVARGRVGNDRVSGG